MTSKTKTKKRIIRKKFIRPKVVLFKDERLRVVIFTTQTAHCPPASAMLCTLDVLHKKEIISDIFVVNVDDNPELIKKYNLKLLPTCFVFWGEFLIRKIQGFCSDNRFIDELRKRSKIALKVMRENNKAIASS